MRSKTPNFVGVLDRLPNPGLARLAISVRRLTNKYTGPCMLVRRASDDATLDIPFCNNVLCRSTLATFCSGTTGFVRTWYDQSGNGAHCEQSAAASQTTIFSSGDVPRDAYGIPRVYHSATGQILTFDPTKVPTSSNPATCFAKTRNQTTGGVRSRFSWGTNVASQYRGYETDNVNNPRVTNGSTAAALTTSELNLDLIGTVRFSTGTTPGETIRCRYDNATDTVQSNSASPSTWTTGTTFGKIWGRPADTTSVVGYSQEYIFVEANIPEASAEMIYRNMEEFYGFNR